MTFSESNTGRTIPSTVDAIICLVSEAGYSNLCVDDRVVAEERGGEGAARVVSRQGKLFLFVWRRDKNLHLTQVRVRTRGVDWVLCVQLKASNGHCDSVTQVTAGGFARKFN